MSRRETIRLLLERWADLLEPRQEGRGGEPGLSLMPHDRGCSLFSSSPPHCDCYRRSVSELQRLLIELRNEPQLRFLRWQLLERYVHCQSITREVQVRARDKHGRFRRGKQGPVYDLVRRPVLVYDSKVEADQEGMPVTGGLLDAGIAWLAHGWRGPEPRLPSDWRYA